MPLSIEDIVRDYVDDGSKVERISHRNNKQKMIIVEPNPAWPQRYLDQEARIEAALGSTVVSIHHTGSTSVPGLPAKDCIDIDMIVKDIDDENAYIPSLERLGFRFLLRDPGWHEQRFLVDEGDRLGSYPINLHVFPQDCAAVEKHRIFREWLRKTPEDLQLYAKVKREGMAASTTAGESMQQYTERKTEVIAAILNRAFRELGYIK